MDFDDTPEEAAFRSEARSWLEANAAPRGGPDDWSDGFFDASMDDDELMARSRAWQRCLWDAGWAGISYPIEWHGRGGSVVQELIFAQEMADFGVSTGAFMVAHTMVGPAILTLGTDEQRHRFLPAMLRGDEMWCQLFSEPGAGSDLAGLTTRAVLDGDRWIVNGQKVWTSNAETSQWGILLARTDPESPRHGGITYFLVDMTTPGIEVRPLRQITGESHFSEVFLTDVAIPVDQVLGGPEAVNQGWGAALHTLANERAMIGGNGHMADVGGLIAWARAVGRADDPTVRQHLAAAHSRDEVLRFLGYRARTALAQGRPPGPETSIMKLFMADHLAKLGSLGKMVQGASGLLTGGEGAESTQVLAGSGAEVATGPAILNWRFLYAPSIGIAGGTNQVQRSIIGERVLGLPREPK
ncbi:MAG TPA: acyl-CoA dehydrogenase family protein [Acidimicrobiales bacterium]